jgi:hypothetical protein
MMCCDLCGKTADCVQKEIDRREFDLCSRCWHSLADKLSGKGRTVETLEEFEETEEYEETLI